MTTSTSDMPDAESVRVPTLNKQGWMLTILDSYTQAFVDFSAGCSLPVIDIGAAYGVASIPALEKGAQVIAIDIDERHLEILRGNAPKNANLITKCAEVPEGLDFEDGSIGAVLAARVLHFLEPPRFQEALAKIHRWLAPGGKLFLTAESPYLGIFSAFTPIYEERRAAGDLWAGLMTEPERYAPLRSPQLPSFVLLLDPDVLRREAVRASFKVERCDFIPRPDYLPESRRDGRESVGLIAVK